MLIKLGVYFVITNILEWIFVSVEARIEENETLLVSLQKQVRAHFKMASLQIPRKVLATKFDELVQAGTEPRLSDQVLVCSGSKCWFEMLKNVMTFAIEISVLLKTKVSKKIEQVSSHLTFILNKQ